MTNYPRTHQLNDRHYLTVQGPAPGPGPAGRPWLRVTGGGRALTSGLARGCRVHSPRLLAASQPHGPSATHASASCHAGLSAGHLQRGDQRSSEQRWRGLIQGQGRRATPLPNLVLQGTAIGLSVFYSLEAGHWVQLTLERERLPEEGGGRGPP